MSTNRGLCRFDPTARTFRNYDVGDGLQSMEFNQGALCRGRDGTLYFGDQAGNVYALDAATGQNKKWSVKVDGGVKMTPLEDNGIVDVGTDRNLMYAFKANTGQSIWAAPYKARDGESLMVTPNVFNATLVVLPNLAGGTPKPRLN